MKAHSLELRQDVVTDDWTPGENLRFVAVPVFVVVPIESHVAFVLVRPLSVALVHFEPPFASDNNHSLD